MSTRGYIQLVLELEHDCNQYAAIIQLGAATFTNANNSTSWTIEYVVVHADLITLDSALASRMESGAVVRFGFNYGTDYHLETGFLVKNSEGYFCLVGEPITASWSEPGRIESIVTTEDSPDDLDFEMF
jgi:hypothetical protein